MPVIKVVDIYGDIHYIPIKTIASIYPLTLEDGTNACITHGNGYVVRLSDNFEQLESKFERAALNSILLT
jgi:hypothetical protein